MINSTINIAVRLLVLVCALSLQACHSVEIKLPAKEKKVTEALLANPRPVCVGRYMFDLPEQFSQGGSSVIINDKRIEAQPMPLPAFEQRIRLREQEIAATKTIREINAPFLKGVHQLPSDMVGVVFERNSTPGSPDLFRVFEAHYYHDGIAFKTEIETENSDAERHKDERELFPTNITAKLSELHNLLGRLRGVKEGDPMPEGPALCFNHGYLVGDSRAVTGSEYGKEQIRMVFWQENLPRLIIRFTTNNYLQTDTTLLERMSGASMAKLLLRFGAKVKTLHKGSRTIKDTYAEELLVYNGSDPDEKEYNYLMYINEQHGSNTTPFLEVEMDYGPIGKGTEPDELTEKQLRAIWYQLTDSIRIRPGAI